MSDLNALNLEAGEEIGGYTLVSRLGSGAMGSVWRVKDGGGQEYAMKILRDSLVDEGDTASEAAREQATARERLRREAMALRRIKHPGVCSIVDMELDDAVAFIVTELIEGRNLREDVAVNGRYVGDDLERLSRKLIDAVKAVHAAGIVHRDIKPTNVMVAASGPVLVDFGIAMGEGESHVTRTGLVMGTPGFIAPEIIDGTESSEATDWWSTASVLAFAATGQPVFGTKPMMAVLEREARGNANLAGLPARTAAAFQSALSPDPGRRCTPDQLLQAIAVDALDPAAWDDAQRQMIDGRTVAMPPDGTPRNIQNGNSSQQGSTMLPFDPLEQGPHRQDPHEQAPPEPGPSDAGTGDAHDNPRKHWASQPQQPGNTTTGIPADGGSGDATEVIGDAPTVAAVCRPPTTRPANGLVGGTAVLPQTERTQVMANPVQQAETAVMPPGIPPSGNQQDAAPAPQDASHPNAADLRRARYLKRGTLPLLLLAVPLAVLAAGMPLIGLIVAGAALWLLTAVGLNADAQLERESKRGGNRKRGDGALRAVTMPWHLLKGLALAIPRVIVVAAIMMLGTVVAALALALPTVAAPWHWQGWVVPFVLLAGSPLSASGLALGGFMAIGWLASVFTPGATPVRIGAGVLRGLPSEAQTPAGTPDPAVDGQSGREDATRTHTRGTVLLVVWLLLLACAATAMAMSGSIDWAPLVVA